MKRYSRVFPFLLACYTSCGFHTPANSFHYKYSGQLPARSVATSKSIGVIQVDDRRSTKEPPLVDVITDALRQGLSSAGYRLSDAGPDFEMRAELEDYSHESSLFSSTVKTRMSLRVRIFERKTNQVACDEVITGHAFTTGDAFTMRPRNPTYALELVLDDVVRQVIESEALRGLQATF